LLEITFDPAKNAANLEKHGVPLELAENVDWSEVWCDIDGRRDYRELREVGYAMIGGRLYCMVFTQRGATMHVISLRKANNREKQNYAQYA
jgi:uncharacterized protein